MKRFMEDYDKTTAENEGRPRQRPLESRNLLRAGLPPGALDALQRIVDRIDQQYLSLWAQAIDQRSPGRSVPSVERTARAIASYLLGKGFSPAHLHRWLTYQLTHNTQVLS